MPMIISVHFFSIMHQIEKINDKNPKVTNPMLPRKILVKKPSPNETASPTRMIFKKLGLVFLKRKSPINIPNAIIIF